MSKADYNDPKKPNVKALQPFRLKGEVIKAGTVLPKAAFANAGEWQNMAHMEPPRVEEVADGVAAAPAADKKSGGVPKG